ncbi:UNVERIFIED_CONTAM: hypothetical protein Sradi_3062500 [Sesamum radiatum]|uniref:Uncharacterized protein n=1 Tax=Sesamum radiatum TaxID=300843 RepID=A0AAW2RBJ4_SESRA
MQIQELHRLYARQQELMNEIKRRELNKDDMKGEKHRSSSLFSPIPPGMQKEHGIPLIRWLIVCRRQALLASCFPVFRRITACPFCPHPRHKKFEDL